MSKLADSIKLPPQNLDAERSVLGSLLIGGQEAFDELAEKLQPELRAEEFYADVNGRVFRAAHRCWQESKPVDAITVAEALGKDLDEVGGVPYLDECMASVPHAAHVVHHAEIVRTKAQLRTANEAFTQGLRELDDARDAEDLAELLGRHESRLHKLIEQDAGNSTVEISEAITELFDAADQPQLAGIATGWPDLDAVLTGGLRGGRLYILAARPSVGKTALAGNLALHLAQRDEGVMFISLEQSRTELAERLLSSLSGIDASRIRNGERLTASEQKRLADSSNRLGAMPIAINDASSRTVQQITALARLRKRRKGLSLLVIDYLQLVNPEDRRVHREQQVATMSRGIKCLARDLEIPVVCLAQLNRAVETRDIKRPKLADLRESGAIEQDADVVMFLHRPSLYDAKAAPGEALLIVAKNRHGRIGDVPLHWNANILTFQSAAMAGQREQYLGFEGG